MAQIVQPDTGNTRLLPEALPRAPNVLHVSTRESPFDDPFMAAPRLEEPKRCTRKCNLSLARLRIRKEEKAAVEIHPLHSSVTDL